MDIVDKETGLPLPTHQEKNMALFAHLASFGSLVFPFGNILGPMIVWLVKKDESVFVDTHGKESLNFQITYTIGMLLLVGLGSFFAISSGLRDNDGGIAISIILALGLIILLWFTSLIFVIVASVKASRGEIYHYPVSIRFVS